MNNSQSFLSAEALTKHFVIGKHRVDVLKGVSFHVNAGEWIALLGASGSGKTTLLDILGTISKPDSGNLMIAGKNVSSMSSRALTAFRRTHIGFVFQAYHILPELNVLENVMLPALLAGMNRKECRALAESCLEKVRLTHRLTHRPNELSGGEQQRAAIARALMNKPDLLLADEPTGNLDSVTGKEILEIFQKIQEMRTASIIMVTHDRSVAALADRVVELQDGVIRPC